MERKPIEHWETEDIVSVGVPSEGIEKLNKGKECITTKTESERLSTISLVKK